jgi:phosphomannomutase
MPIQFGTDGWRAVVSEDFTFENVRRVAPAIADKTLADATLTPRPNGAISMVVGFDTRFLSDRYAMAVAKVLAANGIQVWLAQGDAPTPLISDALVDKQAQGGVMITASRTLPHDKAPYNGSKLKAIYTNLINGASPSLTVGLFATFISLVTGGLIGLIAGL